MEYRRLGTTGLKVSEIALGGTTFGGILNEKDSLAVIQKALDSGITLLDAADVYGMGGGAGKCEEWIGKAIKGRRNEVVLATKFGAAMGKGPNDQGCSRYHIMDAMDASLKRLGTDHVDIYYIHHPDPSTPMEETLRAMDDLIHAGKTRYIGACNLSGWELCQSYWTSRLNALEPFAVAQGPYNPLDRRIEAELLPCCRANGIGLVTYWPLAEGFLTGKYQRGQVAPAGSRFADPRFKRMADGVLKEKNYDILEKLQAFAKDHGHTIAGLAIAWLLAHPYVNSIIAAATKPEQVAANVAAAGWKLTAQELSGVDKLLPEAPGADYLSVFKR